MEEHAQGMNEVLDGRVLNLQPGYRGLLQNLAITSPVLARSPL